MNDCHVTDNNCHVTQLMTMCHAHLASESHLQWTCCRSCTWQKFVWVAWSLGLASFFGHQIMPYEGKSGNIEEGREGGRRKGGSFLRIAASLTNVFCALLLALFPGACEQGYFVPWWTIPPFYQWRVFTHIYRRGDGRGEEMGGRMPKGDIILSRRHFKRDWKSCPRLCNSTHPHTVYMCNTLHCIYCTNKSTCIFRDSIIAK